VPTHLAFQRGCLTPFLETLRQGRVGVASLREVARGVSASSALDHPTRGLVVHIATELLSVVNRHLLPSGSIQQVAVPMTTVLFMHVNRVRHISRG
jgi:hypothetical protein